MFFLSFSLLLLLFFLSIYVTHNAFLIKNVMISVVVRISVIIEHNIVFVHTHVTFIYYITKKQTTHNKEKIKKKVHVTFLFRLTGVPP
jgi:hypothetical protein